MVLRARSGRESLEPHDRDAGRHAKVLDHLLATRNAGRVLRNRDGGRDHHELAARIGGGDHRIGIGPDAAVHHLHAVERDRHQERIARQEIDPGHERGAVNRNRCHRIKRTLHHRNMHRLEESAILSRRLQPEAFRLARDVLDPLGILDGAGDASLHRIRGKDEEPRPQVLGRDGGGGRRRRMRVREEELGPRIDRLRCRRRCLLLRRGSHGNEEGRGERGDAEQVPNHDVFLSGGRLRPT